MWKKLTAGVVANVLGQQYFSEVCHNGQRVKFLNLPKDYSLSRSGNKAVLEFVMPLAEPQQLAGQRFEILTFDPTYFVFVDTTGAARTRSAFVLATPKPDDSLKQYALSLDKADAPPEQMDLAAVHAKGDPACH
ncbi:ABC-type uncharacterized transport system, periplasmic component|nr:ABC-type uncharacterized transport system, periplasmic component [Candidatus Pantoea persica]